MPYNRAGALSYASRFWDRVCHDGRVGSNWKEELRAIKRQQHKAALFASSPALTLLSEVTYPTGQQEDDCTHFISCCIGFSGNAQIPGGGGLQIGQPYGGNPFGFDNPDGLIFDLVPKNLAVKLGPPAFLTVSDPSTATAIGTQLTAGDLLAYADSSLAYQHMAIIVEILSASTAGAPPSVMIAYHTHPRAVKQLFTVVGWPNVRLIKIR